MSSSNTSMLEGDRNPKGDSNPGPSAHRKTNYDSDASSAMMSMDELVTEPDASEKLSDATNMSRPTIGSGGPSNTSSQRQESSSGIPSASHALPPVQKESTSTAQPQAAGIVTSPGTQSTFSPVDSPVNPRFNPNYPAATFNMAQLIQEMAKPGDFGFERSHTTKRGSQNVNLSTTAAPDHARQDPTNPFIIPPTPAYPTAASTSNTSSFTSNSTRIPGRQPSNTSSPKPYTQQPEPAVPTSNNEAQSSSRAQAARRLTEEDLNARMDEAFDIAPPPLPPRPQNIATTSTNNNTNTTNVANTPSSPGRRQSRIVDHGPNRLTILPDDFDDYDFSVDPDTHANDTGRGIYNPYITNRVPTPPWERRSNRTGETPATHMDEDNVPASLIDWDAAIGAYYPPPQLRQARPQTPGQNWAPPARSVTPGNATTRHYSVDDDRLLVIQLAEEQRRMLMDQAVALYLEQTPNPLDDCSYDNLVRHGLVAQDILDMIEQFDTTALEAAAVSPIPTPAPNSPPTRTAHSRSDSPFPGQASGNGKGAQLDDDGDNFGPLFTTNVNQIDPSAQSLVAASQSPISVFIQTPATTQAQAQASSTPRPPTVTSNCGICFETFQVVAAPREAANLSAFASNAGKGKAVAPAPDSNAASEYGVLLPCANSHGFCIDCLTQYIKSKLHSGISLEGRGFPIGCPGCNAKNSRWEVDDDMAERVLDEETLEFWRRQKLLLSLPGVIYCPNDRCSELLAPPEDLVPDMPTSAQCPSCTCSLCFQCGALWHPDLTCKENEALKEHEDKDIYIMAKKQNWRRCLKYPLF
ncbi:hypothetical protein FRC04_006676 [Tulasnella sp. 424]|nr:hypothetical protein FRC04_006676 [Tulasnella sp. 424]